MAAPLVMSAVAKHTATVIFMHGLGDTGFGWASAVEMWQKRGKLNHVKFVLPHAPSIPVTVNGGMVMPAWFDIAALGGSLDDIKKNQDEPGHLKTREFVHGLIQAEIDAGIPSNRIIVGGFSMGAAMSHLSALTAKVKLAGVVGLSSWLPLDHKFPDLVKEAGNVNQDTPIFMGHGTVDPYVPFPLGQLTAETLKQQGFSVEFKSYPGMAHSACLEELMEVESFMAKQLPADEGKSEL
ncbi:Phospholipase/carboxylesterase/thioesterase [Xylariaceae sp. FL1272]|nr:Phospholipase/carboxylesterase/thioesterase [Xylariaceae sp. FL1272]